MSKIEPYSENYSVAHDILLFPWPLKLLIDHHIEVISGPY